MSEMPIHNDTPAAPKSFGPLGIIILVVVFAPAAMACVMSLLHP